MIFVFIRSLCRSIVCNSKLHISSLTKFALSHMADRMAKFVACAAALQPAVSALSTSQLATKLNFVVPKIKDILEDCREKQAGCTQPAVEKITKLCLEHDLAYQKNIHPRECGIHPENRARSGVDPVNAQQLLNRITLQGYADSKLESPMGFEMAEAGTTAASAQKEFMKKNFAQSDGYLRTVPHEDVTYLPVTCSHTMACLNIILRGRTHGRI